MKILFVSAEVAPFAKVGGLADVAGALPKALRALGHDVRVIMPLYRMIENDPRWTLSTLIEDFDVEIGPHWTKRAVLKETHHDGVPIMFVGTDEWFPRAVDSESLYQPGGDPHLFLSSAIFPAMERIDWIPDVVHCNDWHTGFVPVLMREREGKAWDDVATVFTIHNLAYQGEFGVEILDRLGLSRRLFTYDRLETFGQVNFLKAGCVYSDQVNTVSPRYAKEIQTTEYGCALEGLLRYLECDTRLSGILNGIDVDVFNPETDPDLPAHFSADRPENKAACRAALLKEVGLPEIPGAMLMGVVSRLSTQKGIDLIADAAEQIFAMPTQLVIQGLGDPSIADRCRDLERRFPDHFRFLNRFDAPLAQRVYGGCDAFLMPSSFEPCGLGQMIAMRYGTAPIVRATGGLADTVIEGTNGFTFAHRSAAEMLAAVQRAYKAFSSPSEWSCLIQAGMTADLGWDRSALRYSKLYQRARKHVAKAAALDLAS